MEAYKRGSHTVLGLQECGLGDEVPASGLGGDVGQRCREPLREAPRAHEIMFHAGRRPRPCAHVAVDPTEPVGVSRSAAPEGKSSHKLLSEFGILRKRYWRQHLWSRAC